VTTKPVVASDALRSRTPWVKSGEKAGTRKRYLRGLGMTRFSLSARARAGSNARESSADADIQCISPKQANNWAAESRVNRGFRDS
jgi:hypothetical protein